VETGSLPLPKNPTPAVGAFLRKYCVRPVAGSLQMKQAPTPLRLSKELFESAVCFFRKSILFVFFIVRLLLAKETKDREEAEKKKQELEEQMSRYSTQCEITQQGLHS